MNTTLATVANQDTFLDTVAAELTSTAYLAALGHGIQGSWIDLKLALWRAVTEAVKHDVRQRLLVQQNNGNKCKAE